MAVTRVRVRDCDLELFPPGSLVVTPTGRVGWVERYRGEHSKRDHFVRVVVRFSDAPRDTVVLQPRLLRRAERERVC